VAAVTDRRVAVGHLRRASAFKAVAFRADLGMLGAADERSKIGNQIPNIAALLATAYGIRLV